MALPQFQRGYVWNRDQVRSLMHSLYRGFPIGGLRAWVTSSETADARGDQSLPPGSVKLLLDGQQRMSTLYGLIRGEAPPFFDGDDRAFRGLYLHLDDEVFEFYRPTRMDGNPLWVDVTELMRIGSGKAIENLAKNHPELASNLQSYINRLNRIDNIKQVELHIEEVAGEDKTVDTVVEIFNLVNGEPGTGATASRCPNTCSASSALFSFTTSSRRLISTETARTRPRSTRSLTSPSSLPSATSPSQTGRRKSTLRRSRRIIQELLNLSGSLWTATCGESRTIESFSSPEGSCSPKLRTGCSTACSRATFRRERPRQIRALQKKRRSPVRRSSTVGAPT